MPEAHDASHDPSLVGTVSPPVDLQDQMMAYARDLRAGLERSRRAREELERTHVETVAALAAAIDVRDEVTGGHVYRVAAYGQIVAETVAPDMCSDPQLIYGCLLHDIGKIAIPDDVLLKPGRLTPGEQEVMRRHVEFGIRFVKQVGFLRPALTVIATHHEMWDGSGYPQGLSGADIPMGSRLFAVCDAFDAMVHDRPYRSALPLEVALSEVRRGAGTQFDPEVVEAFEAAVDRLLQIPQRPAIPRVQLGSTPRSTTEAALVKAAAVAVFEAIEQPMLILDTDGSVLDANQAFLDAFHLDAPPFGLSLEDVLDRGRRFLSEPETARDTLAPLQRDLFSPRLEGTIAMAGSPPREIAWFSNLLRGGPADNVLGRVLVLSQEALPAHRAPSA